MKAKVIQDESGIQWEIKDDGSAEYQKAAQLTREVNEQDERGRKAMQQPGGSFMHFFQGDEAALAIIVRQQRAEIEKLKDAIRRIADQDATLSACDGSVTVQVDGSLTDDERKAIDRVIFLLNHQADDLDKSGLCDYSASHRKDIAALRTLSERLG